MAANDERSIRLLNLVTALQQTSRPLTAEEIRDRVPGYTATEYESFRRTFERDKDDLRSLGIVIEVGEALNGDTGTSGYRIRRDQHELDDPELNESELASLVAATQLVRLSGADPADSTDGMRKLGGFGTSAATQGGSVVVVEVPEHLVAVLDAVLEQRVISLTYRGRQRSVEGDGIRFQRGHWYLLGREHPAADDRTYRVDRIEAISTGEPGAYERRVEPRRVQMRPWEYGDGERHEVTVLLDEVAAQTVAAEDPDLELTPVEPGQDTGVATMTLSVADELRLFRYLAAFLDRVELIGPADVRARFVGWLEAIADGETHH
ncbi:MAG: helix-turn-helix transcriptional regulator [Actinomycetota bacterium]